jgi:hypothetical protein
MIPQTKETMHLQGRMPMLEEDDSTMTTAMARSGTLTSCNAITIACYPVNHDVGLFCPRATSAGAEDGVTVPVHLRALHTLNQVTS